MSEVIARGSVIVVHGTSSTPVPHGLSAAPNLSDIILTPQDDLGGRGCWPSSPDVSTFTVNISFADPDTDHTIAWYILGAGAGAQQVIAKGQVTVPQGSSTVTVTYGLSTTPNLSDIQLQQQDDLGGRTFWLSNLTSSTFQINLSMADPSVPHTFSWYILGVGTSPAPVTLAYPVTVSDVQAALNASYDNTNLVYSVYGLNISVSTFQAHVAFANAYVASILGTTLATTDPKYPVAYNVALDIACIRILVVSMGGSLVGAFDYFLGDLRVARAGPYKEAITATLQGFKDDLSRQLVNITSVAVSFDVGIKSEVPTYKGGLASP